MNSHAQVHFISRSFPPIIGGIENQNKSIYDKLCQHKKIISTINKSGKKALLFFLPWSILKSLFINSDSLTILGDGVLAIVPWFTKKFKKNNVFICIVHGLDITYSSKIYQKLWINLFFSKIDYFIAVSHSTKDLLISRGVYANKIYVIPNGYDFSSINYQPNKKNLSLLLKENIEKRTIILTLGRLVQRKGVKWFIEHVVPKLDSSILYIVAGSGPEEESINELVKTNNLFNKVKLLGQVTESQKQILLSNADLFIQPNIKIENDVEGFGISVIEATAYNLPVIASELEGLKDAIQNNKNGWLVTSGNSDEFIIKIKTSLSDPLELKKIGEKFNRYSKTHFDWSVIIEKYVNIINKLQK